MKRKFLSTLAMLMTGSVLLVGCSTADDGSASNGTSAVAESPVVTNQEPVADVVLDDSLSGKISIAGSTTVASPMEKLQDAFKSVEPGIVIEIQGVGSSAGVKAAADGTAQIGMASREITDSERDEYGLNEIVIAKDAIAVVVHPDNPIDDLTMEQVKDLFEGTITNWSELGGNDQAVAVICREDGSGTRAAFEEIVGLEMDLGGIPVSSVVPTAIIQEGTGAVKATTAAQEGGIGFVSLGYIDDTIKAITIEGASPSVEDTLSGAYPISRPLLILTNGEVAPEVDAFINYILGSEGQAILEAENYVPVG